MEDLGDLFLLLFGLLFLFLPFHGLLRGIWGWHAGDMPAYWLQGFWGSGYKFLGLGLRVRGLGLSFRECRVYSHPAILEFLEGSASDARLPASMLGLMPSPKGASIFGTADPYKIPGTHMSSLFLVVQPSKIIFLI